MLQMTKEQLEGYTGETLNQLLKKVQPILGHRKRLYARYARKQSPDEMMRGSQHKGRERAVVAFEYYIVNMVQGYLGGKAPMYRVAAASMRNKPEEERKRYVEDYSAAVESIRRYNDDAATVLELFHDYLITNAAYLTIWEDKDNEIRYGRRDSLQTVAIFDYSTPPDQIGAVETWKREEEGKKIQEVILTTELRKTAYIQKGEGFQETDSEILQWNDVPFVAFENPDGIAVFEPALSSIDTYEQITTNIRSMSQYNDEAKLLISGYTPSHDPGTPERKAEELAMIKALVLFVDQGGSVEWLLKQINYDGMLSVLRSLHDRITMLTGVPNMTDEAFSNADNASALGYKLYALDQYSAVADRVFRRGYLRLWEIITYRLNLKGAAYDFRDIEIVMQRNVPTDKDKSLDRAVRAYQGGLLSQESAINESQIEIDAKEEILRIKREKAEEFKEIQSRGLDEPEPGKERPSDQGDRADKAGQEE